MVLIKYVFTWIAILFSFILHAQMDTLTDFNKLWDYYDPASTEQKFRELLPAAEVSGDLNYKLQLQTQIARSLGMQRKFDEAHALLDTVEKQLVENTKLAAIRYHLERGRAFNSSKERSKAEDEFHKALKLSTANDQDYYAVDAAHMLAIVKTGEEALKWNIKAVELAEQSDQEDPIKWLGSLYNNIGWTYHDMEEHEKALEYLTKARTWHRKYGSERSKAIAEWCVAKALRMLNKVDEALEILEKLLADGKEDGYTYEELGECYLLKGENEKTREYFSKAFELLSKDPWLVENEKERLDRLKDISSR